MKNNISVSIIIPAYNLENYISKCITSCIVQTLANIEIIVTNDGSSDNTASILYDLAKSYDNIKFINQRNYGVVYARENALKIAEGDYICFIDGDDYIEPNMLEVMVDIAINNNADIVSCDLNIVEDNEENTSLYIQKNKYMGNSRELAVKSLLIKLCTWNLCGKIFKRTLYRNIEPNYHMTIGEDAVICFQLYNSAMNIVHVPSPYYNYVQRKTSAMHSINQKKLSSIVLFIESVIKMRDVFLWDSSYNMYIKTFVLSQIYVYFLSGGDIEYLYKHIEMSFSFKDIITSKLCYKEKILVLIFLKLNTLSRVLYLLFLKLRFIR